MSSPKKKPSMKELTDILKSGSSKSKLSSISQKKGKLPSIKESRDAYKQKSDLFTPEYVDPMPQIPIEIQILQ